MEQPDSARRKGDSWRWGLGSRSQSTISVIENVKTGNVPFGFARALEPERESVDELIWQLACNGIEDL